MAIPLRLDGYFVTELSVKANARFFEAQARPDIVPDVTVGSMEKKTEDDRFGLHLTIEVASTTDAVQPYEIKVGLFGMFCVDKEVPQAERPALIVHNGAHVLYGAARELVLSLTSRGPYGAVMLPLKHFSHYRSTHEVHIPSKRPTAARANSKKKSSK